MRKFWFLLYTLVILACLVQVATTTTDKKTSAEARIAKLEARVDLLEAWAIRHGGKLK